MNKAEVKNATSQLECNDILFLKPAKFDSFAESLAAVSDQRPVFINSECFRFKIRAESLRKKESTNPFHITVDHSACTRASIEIHDGSYNCLL
jgi:hypothetical protein